MFPMETLISYTNKYNKHVHDPVMAEKSFYENLNNQDELAVKLEYIDNPDIEADKLVTDEYWETQNTSYSEVTDDQYTDEPNYPWQLPEDKKSEEANLKEVLDKDVQFILFWVKSSDAYINQSKMSITLQIQTKHQVVCTTTAMYTSITSMRACSI